MRPYLFKGRNPLSALEIRRCQLAGTIFKEIPASLDTLEGAKALNTHSILKSHRCSNFEDSFNSAQDWFINTGPDSMSMYAFDSSGPALLMYTVVCIAGVVYGGVHAFAWDLLFRIYIEEILWKISTCVIMSCGFLFTAFRCFDKF